MATKRGPKSEKKELPLGKSTFSKLVEGNCIYVDKTRYIYPLYRKGGAYFLSRPRRFGKSLTVSILKEIFKGHRDLLKVIGFMTVSIGKNTPSSTWTS